MPRLSAGMWRAIGIALAVFFGGWSLVARGADPVRVQGSSIVARAIAGAVVPLKERGIELKIVVQGGSSGGIAGAGNESADIGLSTRRLTGTDRAAYPGQPFQEVTIGYQALSLIAARGVWDGGVRSLSRKQVLDIYEGVAKNWNQVGGPDLPVKFFNLEPGNGDWEFFAEWLYGDVRKAPLGNQEKVSTGTDARNTVEFATGSMSIASPTWADAREVFALGVRQDDGTLIEPVLKSIAEGIYPISRPLVLITGGKPTGDARRFIDFMLSPEGQEIVRKSDFIPAIAPPAATSTSQ